MKHTLLITLAAALALGNQVAAMDVTSNADNSFSVVGPVDSFTDWAVDGGAIANNFTTHSLPGDGGLWNSGPTTVNTWGTLTIPFNFSAPISTARLDYGATCIAYGWNWGSVELFVNDGTTDTRIFCIVADKNDPEYPNYNYTTSQTPTGNQSYRGYTDISPLVAGKTSFTLTVIDYAGDNGWIYNGGQFLPSAFTDSNFYLTGTTAPVPEPGSILALATGLCGLIGVAARRRK